MVSPTQMRRNLHVTLALTIARRAVLQTFVCHANLAFTFQTINVWKVALSHLSNSTHRKSWVVKTVKHLVTLAKVLFLIVWLASLGSTSSIISAYPNAQMALKSMTRTCVTEQVRRRSLSSPWLPQSSSSLLSLLAICRTTGRSPSQVLLHCRAHSWLVSGSTRWSLWLETITTRARFW